MKQTIEKILEKAGLHNIEISVPEHESQGHYSTNVALRLAKQAKKNPLDLARELAEKIKSYAPEGFFEKIEAVQPGFINFWVSRKTAQEKFAEICRNLRNYGRSNVGQGKTVIVEYSQPNIAKKMHVGHLRTTIIGEALASITELLGYRVIRWNYLGDWGTQFGKLIAAYKMWGNKKRVAENPIEELQALYVKFHDELKNNIALDKRGQEEFKKLEKGDAENRKLWRWFKEESLKEFEKTYEILGIKFDTSIGESFYEKEVKPLVARLIKEKVAKESEGAIVVPLDKYNLPPALIQKSDGASLYLTRDIANLEYRIKKYKPKKILYVVGNEQSLHFEQLFAIADILGWRSKVELTHVKYGLILGEEEKKLATREGRAILLEEVLNKAIQLARQVFEEKNLSRDVEPETTVAKKATVVRKSDDAAISGAEKELIAEAVGIGALKYGILKENRNTDIVFNWKQLLSLSGDSAPYLQYTYARLRSILRKTGQMSSVKCQMSTLTSDAELRLMRKIFEFPEEVARSAEILETNNLTNYLYNLAVLTSRFYETTPVLREPDEARRNALLALIETAAGVLKTGLGLLGIKTPERI